jgi:hypothetical protein
VSAFWISQYRTAALITGFDIDFEQAFKVLRPTQ